MVDNRGMDPENESVLAGIFQGMSVYDSNAEEVGTVDFVYMGASHQEGRGSATTETPPKTGPTLLNNLADAIDPSDDIPDEMRERLSYDGFVRVDPSRLFAADRYILPGQIKAVAGDRVILNVPYEDLVKD